jgi:hypothetical protein
MSGAEAREVSLDDEAAHLLQLYERDASKIMNEIGGQLSILANRAQTLLSLAGITITVTGFSGASIAKTGRLSAALLVAGLVLVLVSAAIAMTGILRVRWTTSIAPSTLEVAVRSALEVRDRKTKAFDRALSLLVVGLTLYVSSVGLLLLGNLPS